MIKGKKKIRIPNPHGSGDIHISLLKEILRQASISDKVHRTTIALTDGLPVKAYFLLRCFLFLHIIINIFLIKLKII